MKQGEEGGCLYTFKAPVALLAMSGGAVARQKEKQYRINRQRAADNMAENTVALFPAVCEFIMSHAGPLVISKCMQLI